MSLYSKILTKHDRPIFANFGPSIPRRVASCRWLVKLRKRWQIYVIGLHFGTGIIDVSLTHFLSKRPILHSGLSRANWSHPQLVRGTSYGNPGWSGTNHGCHNWSAPAAVGPMHLNKKCPSLAPLPPHSPRRRRRN